jgi:hypothetical protein
MKRCIPAVLVILAVAVPARAQSFEAGIHVASASWSEFDGTDLGVGGRLSWLPVSMLGVDADLTVYPSDFPPDTSVPFSGRRFEGLFGVTIGPRLGAVRPFAKAGAGFLQIGDTPVAFACIAIFPPPLACTLAGGDTLAAYEIGGGVAVNAGSRTFVRVDVADRMLSYPGPTLRADLSRADDGFVGHALRFTIGGGIRF